VFRHHFLQFFTPPPESVVFAVLLFITIYYSVLGCDAGLCR
jgi:hypothetical protein